jgi:hypothetical protein
MASRFDQEKSALPHLDHGFPSANRHGLPQIIESKKCRFLNARSPASQQNSPSNKSTNQTTALTLRMSL